MKGEEVTEGQHYNEKVKALRQMKELKKSLKGQEDAVLMFCMDAEQALTVPKLLVDAAYYRLKLLFHNMTFCNMIDSKVKCYVYTERDASSKAEVFASCISNYVSNHLLKNPHTKQVVIFSDSCAAQNKSQTLANVLLALAMKHNIPIEHHYLVVGHTHMQVDTFHACVEAKIRNLQLYCPEDYVEAIKTAKPSAPDDVEILRLDWEFFTSLGVQMVKSIRPGRAAGDPTVAEVRAYQYLPDGSINYKLLVDEEFRKLPQQVKIPAHFPENQRLFDGPQVIADNKLKHLNELLPYIPEEKKNLYKASYL